MRLPAVPAKQAEDAGHLRDAVGQHGALDHIQVGQDEEDEEAEADDVHRLEADDDQRVRDATLRRRLEEAHSERAGEREDLGKQEGEEHGPDPHNLNEDETVELTIYYHVIVINISQTHSLAVRDLRDVVLAPVDLHIAEGDRLHRPDLRGHHEEGDLSCDAPGEHDAEA